MLEYYQIQEGDSGLFGALMGWIQGITGSDNSKSYFGSLWRFITGDQLLIFYHNLSWLQYLVLSQTKLARRASCCYFLLQELPSLLPLFVDSLAGSFLLLVMSRLISGLMGSNIPMQLPAAQLPMSLQRKPQSEGMALSRHRLWTWFYTWACNWWYKCSLMGHVSQSVTGRTMESMNFHLLHWLAYHIICSVRLLRFLLIERFPETLDSRTEKAKSKEKSSTIRNPFKLFQVEKIPWCQFSHLG